MNIKKIWEEESKADKMDKYNLVELMNQVQGKEKNCLDFWIEVNSWAAEIELENNITIHIWVKRNSVKLPYCAGVIQLG